MSALYHNGHWYGGGQDIDIQSDPTATSFNAGEVPTGDTVQSVLNSKIAKVTVTRATSSAGCVDGSTSDIIGIANAHILSAYLEREPLTLGAYREANVRMYGMAGYSIECKQSGNLMASTNVKLTIFYTLI